MKQPYLVCICLSLYQTHIILILIKMYILFKGVHVAINHILCYFKRKFNHSLTLLMFFAQLQNIVISVYVVAENFMIVFRILLYEAAIKKIKTQT